MMHVVLDLYPSPPSFVSYDNMEDEPTDFTGSPIFKPHDKRQ